MAKQERVGLGILVSLGLILIAGTIAFFTIPSIELLFTQGWVGIKDISFNVIDKVQGFF